MALAASIKNSQDAWPKEPPVYFYLDQDIRPLGFESICDHEDVFYHLDDREKGFLHLDEPMPNDHEWFDLHLKHRPTINEWRCDPYWLAPTFPALYCDDKRGPWGKCLWDMVDPPPRS